MRESAEEQAKWHQAQIQAATDLVNRGGQALRQGQNDMGLAVLLEAEAIMDMVQETDLEVRRLQARIFNELGVLRQRQDRMEESLSYHERAAALCDELIESGEDFVGNAAATYLNLSSVNAAMGKGEKAAEFGERALELVEGLEEEEAKAQDPLKLGALQNLAVIRAGQKKWEDANQAMERATEIAGRLAEQGQPNFLAQIGQGCLQLSVLLFEAKRFDDALEWGRKAEDLAQEAYEALGAPVLSIYLTSQLNLVSYYERLGKFADAEDALWKALDVAGNDPVLLHRGTVFYENCRKQADARLEAGDLPRDEVDSGLEELMERVEAAGGLERVTQLAQQAQAARR